MALKSLVSKESRNGNRRILGCFIRAKDGIERTCKFLRSKTAMTMLATSLAVVSPNLISCSHKENTPHWEAPAPAVATISTVDSMLFDAVEKRDKKKIRGIVLYGVDVNCRNKRGWTPLMESVIGWDGNLVVGSLLIKLGAKVDAKTSDGSTALMLAMESCDAKACEFLIEHGANMYARDTTGRTVLMHSLGDINCCRVLIEKVAEKGGNVKKYIEAKDKYGENALMHAAAMPGCMAERPAPYGDTEVCAFLLEKLAKYGGNVRKFIEAKTSYDWGDGGRTALMNAAQQNNLEICKLLLEKLARYGGNIGEYIDVEGNFGATALELSKGYDKTYYFLKKEEVKFSNKYSNEQREMILKLCCQEN
jgi:ankyrin repeat protein